MITNNDLIIYNNLKLKFGNTFFRWFSQDKIIYETARFFDKLKIKLVNYENSEYNNLSINNNFNTNNMVIKDAKNELKYRTGGSETYNQDIDKLNDRVKMINTELNNYGKNFVFAKVDDETLIEFEQKFGLMDNGIFRELYTFNLIFPNFATFYDKLKDVVFVDFTNIPRG